MDGFLVGILFLLFVLFVLVIFGVIFAAAVCFVDFGKSASKPPFDPFITDDEQNLFVSRFKSFSFDEMPQFLYGIRNIPPRSIQTKQ